MHIGITGPIETEQLKGMLKINPHKKIPKGLGGIPVNLLIKELYERGFNISVYSLSPDVTINENILLEGERIKIFFGCYRERAKHRAIDLFKYESNVIKEFIINDKPDIVHAHWQYEFAKGALKSQFPTLITCHDAPLSVLRTTPSVYRLLRLFLAISNLLKAKNITAVSPHTKKGNSLFCSYPIKIIPNFEPQWVFNYYKEKMKIPKSPKIVMINNSFWGLKNVSIGIEAFQILRRQIPMAELYLFGSENGLGEDAEIWATKEGLTENVFFKGTTTFDELMNNLSMMDIFLHTSKEESCPMVLIEAMAMGIPIIAGKNSGGVPWVVTKKGGVLCSIKDKGEVANSLFNLLSNEQLYLKASLEARENSVSRFSSQTIVDSYLKIYNTLL